MAGRTVVLKIGENQIYSEVVSIEVFEEDGSLVEMSLEEAASYICDCTDLGFLREIYVDQMFKQQEKEEARLIAQKQFEYQQAVYLVYSEALHQVTPWQTYKLRALLPILSLLYKAASKLGKHFPKAGDWLSRWITTQVYPRIMDLGYGKKNADTMRTLIKKLGEKYLSNAE